MTQKGVRTDVRVAELTLLSTSGLDKSGAARARESSTACARICTFLCVGPPQYFGSNNHVEHDGAYSEIPHPPPGDHRKCGRRNSFLNTGWNAPVPSRDGGSLEKDFMRKPPYGWQSEGQLFSPKYYSQCWCGNVVFEFHGDPVDAKHCHCRQCQHLHGAPFQWAVIFPKTSVRMVKNQENSLHFFSTQRRRGLHDVPCKVSCDQCRSPLFDEGRNTVLAYPSSFKFPDGKVPVDFQPTAHIFYSERVMEVPDGVPKWSGHKGTSELLPELTTREGTLPKDKGKSGEGQIDLQ